MSRPANTRVVEQTREGSQSLAVRFAWYGLVGAFVLSSLVWDLSGLYSGWYFLKDWIIRLLVAASLVAWGYAAVKGHATARWHTVAWVPVALLAWLALGLLISESPAAALVGTPTGGSGWITLASCMFGGFLTLQLTDRASRVRDLMRAVAITAAVSAAYGLIQSMGLDWVSYDLVWGSFRSFGTLGNPDMFGAFMVLGLPVTMSLVLSETDSRWRYAAGIAFVLIGTGTFTSLTRAAWLGALVGALTLVALLWPLKPKVGRFEMVLVVVLAVCIAAFGAVSLNAEGPDSNVGARAASLGDASSRNAVARLEVWRAAAAAIADRPITGWGPGTFHLAFEEHRTAAFSGIADPNTTMTSAHNWILQTAAEAGVVGLTALVGFLAAVAVLSARWIRRATVSQARSRLVFGGAWAACAGFLVASLLTPGSPPSQLLLWCLLGALLAPLAVRSDRPSGAAARLLSWSAIASGIVLLLLALAAVYADTRAAVAADEHVAPEVRVEAAEAAMRVNPLEAEYALVAMNARANLVPATGVATAGARHPEFDKALAAAERAITLEPTNPYRTAAFVALLLVGGQDVDPQYAKTAVTTAAAAIEKWPNHLDLAYQYARALVEVGRDADAVSVLRYALDVRPGFSQAALLLSNLYVQSGDTDAARAVLQASLEQVKNEDVRATLAALNAEGQ